MRGRSLAGDGGFRQGSDGGRRPFLFLNFYKGKRDGYESGINFHTGCLCVVRRRYEVLQKLVRNEYEGGTKVVRRVRKWYKFPHGMLVRGTKAVRSVVPTWQCGLHFPKNFRNANGHFLQFHVIPACPCGCFFCPEGHVGASMFPASAYTADWLLKPY